jgi:hypothetical protein
VQIEETDGESDFRHLEEREAGHPRVLPGLQDEDVQDRQGGLIADFLISVLDSHDSLALEFSLSSAGE